LEIWSLAQWCAASLAATNMRNLRIEDRPSGRPGTQRSYRGSRKRIRRIRMQDHWSVELWLFVIFVLLALFIVVPWLIRHPPARLH
jgi:hypothetical protein